MNKLFRLKRNHEIKLTFMIATFIIGAFFLSCHALAATVEDRIEDFVYPKPKPEKTVYLTFDDGPSQYSHELMDLLEEYDVPAIFFVIGENLELLPNAKDILNEMLSRGHYIGLHSMTHNMQTLYNSPNAPQNFVRNVNFKG